MFQGYIEHVDRANEIVAIVEPRCHHRFTDKRTRCEVHDRSRLMRPHNLLQTFHIENVTNFERSPANRPAIARAEIVISNGTKARLRKSLAGMASDVSSASSNQNNVHQ
jgi:hypothetical protein